MERLTEWIGEDEDRQAIPKPNIRSNGYKRCCNKLAEYEDAEEEGVLVRSPYKPGDYVYCAEKYLRGYEVCAYKYLAKVKGYIAVYIPAVNMGENVDESLAEMCKDSQEWYKLDAIYY